MAESLTGRRGLGAAEATAEFAQSLAQALPAPYAGWLLLLQGELGAGKSSLARAMLHALGHEGPVPSPTYTLVEPYELPRGPVYHVDLYRVASLSELEFLGWSELRDGLLLVEWPERVPTLVDEADVQIGLQYEGSGRRVVLEALSARAVDWLQASHRVLGLHLAVD